MIKILIGILWVIAIGTLASVIIPFWCYLFENVELWLEDLEDKWRDKHDE